VRLWPRLQEACGWQNAWAAVRLAERFAAYASSGGEVDEGEAAAWLDGWLAARGDERRTMLDGRMTDAAAAKKGSLGRLGWRSTQTILTPISGHRRPMSSAGLQHRGGQRRGARRRREAPH